MNCKPGDLAIWKKRGVLVEVLSLSFSGEKYPSENCDAVMTLADESAPAWRVRMTGALQYTNEWPRDILFRELPVMDRGLRPIRDEPGNEEWFQAAPLKQATPKKVTA